MSFNEGNIPKYGHALLHHHNKQAVFWFIYFLASVQSKYETSRERALFGRCPGNTLRQFTVKCGPSRRTYLTAWRSHSEDERGHPKKSKKHLEGKLVPSAVYDLYRHALLLLIEVVSIKSVLQHFYLTRPIWSVTMCPPRLSSVLVAIQQFSTPLRVFTLQSAVFNVACWFLTFNEYLLNKEGDLGIFLQIRKKHTSTHKNTHKLHKLHKQKNHNHKHTHIKRLLVESWSAVLRV